MREERRKRKKSAKTAAFAAESTAKSVVFRDARPGIPGVQEGCARHNFLICPPKRRKKQQLYFSGKENTLSSGQHQIMGGRRADRLIRKSVLAAQHRQLRATAWALIVWRYCPSCFLLLSFPQLPFLWLPFLPLYALGGWLLHTNGAN